jgi:hypothetical protein
MKAFGWVGSGFIDPCFIDLGTSWHWVGSVTCRPLSPRGRASGTLWMADWVGSIIGLDYTEGRKVLLLLGLELWPFSHPAHKQFLYQLCYMIKGTNCALQYVVITVKTSVQQKQVMFLSWYLNVSNSHLTMLNRGPLSLVSTIEELLERKSSGSGLESWDYGRGDVTLTTRFHSAKVGTNFVDKWWLLGLYSSLADSGQGV